MRLAKGSLTLAAASGANGADGQGGSSGGRLQTSSRSSRHRSGAWALSLEVAIYRLTVGSGRGGGVQVFAQEQEPPAAERDPGIWDWGRFDERNLVEVDEFRPHMPLHNFYEGFSAARDGNVAATTIEDAQDRIRAVLERCDNLRVVHALVDMDSAWGGLAHEMLTYVREECPAAIVALFGNDWAYPLADQVTESIFGSPTDVTDRSKMEARRRINIASSIALLSDVSTIVIPIAMAKSSLPSTRFSHLHVDRSNCAQVATLAATSLEIALSAYRGRSAYDLLEVARPNMTIVSLAAAFPFKQDPATLLRNLASDSFSHKSLLDDNYSLLPKVQVDKRFVSESSSQHKMYRRCVTLSGAFPSARYLDEAIDSAGTSSVVVNWTRRSSIGLPESYRIQELAGNRVDAVSQLSLSSEVAEYLGSVAQQAKYCDKRVLFEFTRSGMSPDALEELHSAITGIGGEYSA